MGSIRIVPPKNMKTFTDDCYRESVKLLLKNSTPHGIFAASATDKAKSRNYLTIFGRDASICALGMVLSKDKRLASSAKHGLETLARHQAKNGQIPFYVKPDEKEADFYYLGCIDSTLWWLIAMDTLRKEVRYDAGKLQGKIDKALNWLHCQEHPGFHLLIQNEASDWADLMPRSGFVLYSNALWYRVKRLYGLENAKETKSFFNHIFDNNCRIPEKTLNSDSRLKKFLRFRKPDKSNPTYLSFMGYSVAGKEIDVFGNILACLTGLADTKKTMEIIRFLKDRKSNRPYPIKALLEPIRKKDGHWREYMSHLGLNLPGQYHNGGIWPFIGCFWVMLLSKNSDIGLASDELEKLAELNSKRNWEFNEWFDGTAAKPLGMAGQSWNAAMFIAAWHEVMDKTKG